MIELVDEIDIRGYFEDRFWKFVDKKEDHECWNWLGSINSAGYGNFGFNGKIVGSHMISCIIHNIEIPKGMEVTHLCNNRMCVNPKHLKIATHKDNMEYMIDCKRNYICDNKGEKNPMHSLTECDIKNIREICNNDKYINLAELAKEYGITKGHLYNIISNKCWIDNNYENTRPKNSGENNGRSKLTDDDIKKMRDEYLEGGTSYRELAIKYGVSKGHVFRIIKNVLRKM